MHYDWGMQFSARCVAEHDGRFRMLKAPERAGPPAQRDPAVVATVTEMLGEIERRGIDAVLDYARQLDCWDSPDVELAGDVIAGSGDALDRPVRQALELGAERTQKFATDARNQLTDFETEVAPGVTAGHRYVPVQRVGAYLPAGRFPILASAFMTVGVAKAAGVPTVLACTPPQPDGKPNPAVLYSAHLSGADRVYVLGGVQAVAAMAYGLLGEAPIDMLIGAGNAYVTEAKRQLYGTVSIDLLAGPSEVAVIADDSADPVLVAADLLGQAEHGPDSPAALITTSEALGAAVISEIERQLATLSTRDIAGPAWKNFGSVTVAADMETVVALMDDLAPEHLEISTTDDDYYFESLRNYGSIFLGPWSTVAYSDKGMAGTNHVLPTAGGARHSAGLSVSRFLKPLTYQRVERSATPLLADGVVAISTYEGMQAHKNTATLRLERYAAPR